jgi:hypothetical protein
MAGSKVVNAKMQTIVLIEKIERAIFNMSRQEATDEMSMELLLSIKPNHPTERKKGVLPRRQWTLK